MMDNEKVSPFRFVEFIGFVFAYSGDRIVNIT